MSWGNLGALLWLLPLAAIVIALYLLRMRRRDLRVPAVFLWPERTDEVRANSLFQRLRWNPLLILQLLALALLVIALARPQFRQRGLTGQVTVLVVDVSASMQATDARPSRLAEAKRLAREAIGNAQAGDRIAVIEAGRTPRVAAPLANDLDRARRALEGILPTDGEADVGEAMRLAAALVADQAGSRIVLLSDGVFPPIDDFAGGRAEVVFRRIGGSGENLAIHEFGAGGNRLLVSLRNYGARPGGGSLALRADGRLIDARRIEVPPGGEWSETVPAPAGARRFEAVLDAPDALAADNRAVALRDPGASLRVLFVSRGNLFLERALALDPRVTLDRAAAVPQSEREGMPGPGTYDIAIFDGLPEVPVKARGVLAFGATGDPTPVTAAGEVAAPRFLAAEPHPLLDGVSLDEVYIERQRRVIPRGAGRAIAETTAGPLIVVADTPKRRVYVAFSPLQSDFPLQVGFPIFVANALGYLGGEAAASDLVIRPGQPLVFPPRADGTVRVRGEGADRTVRGTVYGLDRVGTYRVDTGRGERVVHVVARSETESRIAPADAVRIGTGEARATAAPERFEDLWRWLAIIGLGVLAAEWWVFARRS